ncbi:MAG: alpha/beta fold hydrolase [Oceanococcaceae bacterium]
MNDLINSGVGSVLAVNRRAARSLANGMEWMFKRERLVKSGKTWFELVYDGDPMSVRYYGLPDEREITLPDGSVQPVRREKYALPLVLVPPLGVTTETFDLMPQRSLVRYMAAQGFKVYMIDWGRPRKEHAQLGLYDYSHDMFSRALDRIRQHAGVEDLSLYGWCMGGLLCLMYQGFNNDPHVRNLVTVASPIDLRGGGFVAQAAQLVNAPAQLVRKYSNLRLQMLDPRVFNIPPWLTTLAFKLTDPVGSVTTYWDLITRMADREYVESHTTTSDYLNNMLMYPGGVVRDMTSKMAIDNTLADGRIELSDGNVADITRIRANLLAYAGDRDVLVPPEIAARSIDLVASEDKSFRIAPGGHMGVILGSKACTAVWSESADWLRERSGEVCAA